MKILTYFISFIHKAKTFPRLLFLSSIVVCWFGNALSAYANDGNCHAIYIVSYPKDVKLNQTDQFALFHLIGKKPFAKLPTLNAAHNN